MQKSKHKFPFFQSTHIQSAGIFLLIFLAALLLWFNNSNSNQASSAMVAQVRFYGEYRIGDEPWKEITEGKHIPATKGDVTLRGNFHMLTPDGEYVGTYSGDTPIAFYTNHINLTNANHLPCVLMASGSIPLRKPLNLDSLVFKINA